MTLRFSLNCPNSRDFSFLRCLSHQTFSRASNCNVSNCFKCYSIWFFNQLWSLTSLCICRCIHNVPQTEMNKKHHIVSKPSLIFQCSSKTFSQLGNDGDSSVSYHSIASWDKCPDRSWEWSMFHLPTWIIFFRESVGYRSVPHGQLCCQSCYGPSPASLPGLCVAQDHLFLFTGFQELHTSDILDIATASARFLVLFCCFL